MKISFLILQFLLYTLPNFAQKDDFKYISKLKVNEKKVRGLKEGKVEAVYLGEIKNENNDVLFYVITLYSEIHATSHGHPNIYYLDKQYKAVHHYELGGVEEFPFKLSKNKLYFNYVDSTGSNKIFVYDVGITIPKLLCVAPDDCY